MTAPLTADVAQERRRSQRSRAGLRAVLVLVLLACALARWPGSDATVAERGRIMEISANANAFRRAMHLAPPNAIEVGLDAVWVTGTVGERAGLTRLATAPGGRDASIELGAPDAVIEDDLAVGERAVWVLLADGLYRFDPGSVGPARRVFRPLRGDLLGGVAAGGGAVWVIDVTRGMLLRLDPRTGSVTHVVPVGASPNGVAVTEDGVWVTSAEPPLLLMIAADGQRVLGTIPLSAPASALAGGADSVWVAVASRDEVVRIDVDSRRSESIAVGARPTGLAATDDAVWVANSGSNTVSRIDAGTRRVAATIPVPERPYRIAADDERVWVTSLGAPAADE